MDKIRSFLFGVMSCVLTLGCAGMSYRYYSLHEVVYEEGMLLGPTEADDVPFSKCAPSEHNKNPCVVMASKEFFALKLDYEDTKQKLIDCQKDKR